MRCAFIGLLGANIFPGTGVLQQLQLEHKIQEFHEDHVIFVKLLSTFCPAGLDKNIYFVFSLVA